MKKYLSLIVCLAIPFGIAFMGSAVTTPAITGWYASLNKPFFSPPNWVFAPVWTALFLLMGISSYLVWRKEKKIGAPLKIYGVQLVLNFFWSYLFFGLRRPDLAFAEIIVLWIFIALTIKSFYKVNKLAAYFLLPYIIWVSFASALNFFVFSLN